MPVEMLRTIKPVELDPEFVTPDNKRLLRSLVRDGEAEMITFGPNTTHDLTPQPTSERPGSRGYRLRTSSDGITGVVEEVRSSAAGFSVVRRRLIEPGGKFWRLVVPHPETGLDAVSAIVFSTVPKGGVYFSPYKNMQN